MNVLEHLLCCRPEKRVARLCVVFFFFLFLLYCRLVSSKCVWELFWWSVGGSCKKDPCDVRGKGQVLYASALTVKSHLRQKKENKQRVQRL